ncbi:peptidylprolyl isomerase [Malassezia sp. CBS 17886]|nr:peptidylprolyl isomerase [Malassezia sp. CBS 17886]
MLYQTFATFGEVNDVQLPKASDIGLYAAIRRSRVGPGHRGFAFITYTDGADAEDAIDNMHLNELRGNILSVNLAKPQAVQGDAVQRPVWETEEWRQTYGGETADVPVP